MGKVQYLTLLVCLTTGTATAQYRYDRPSKPFRPSVSVISPPSTDFGVPSRPSTVYGVPSRPSTDYGVPSRPSTDYGVPSRPSTDYGVPSRPSRPTSSHSFQGGNDYYYDEPANYQFKYDVDAPDYGTFFGHQESRQGDVARGEYYALLPDGRTQHVTYVADRDGYRPTITYEGGGGGNFGRY
ncbi:hypothetical protein J6590_029934 [Homalodisca vitripennis]|nr:hypothetical protein J6590_029934 [Homalodisca vitripennis]